MADTSDCRWCAIAMAVYYFGDFVDVAATAADDVLVRLTQTVADMRYIYC